MTTTTHSQTSAQARTAAVESDYAPLYAAAGLTDLAVESIRNLVLATQEKASKRLKTLPEQVKALPEHLRTLPETTKGRIEELDKQRKEFLAGATVTYGDLAGRGKKVIDDSVIAVRKTSADVQSDVAEKAEEMAEKLDEVREDVAAAVDPELAAAAREAAGAKRSAAAKKAAATRKANAAKKQDDGADV